MEDTKISETFGNIKTMKLYSHVARIYNELSVLGYGKNESLSVADVNRFDQYHYYGTEAIDDAISQLHIQQSNSVLDIGSGIGGPARYLAHKVGCHVTAIELQDDLHKTAEDLTERCGLKGSVKHICGDFMNLELDGQQFHLIVSWLVFLHVPQKDILFSKCNKVLSPGGKLYAADYFQKRSFTDENKNDLREHVFCESLPTKEEYIKHLENNGFCNVQFEDVTESWTAFVGNRSADHINQKERYARVHGEEIYREQLHFFEVINRLFRSGNLGGCHVTAQRADNMAD